MPEARPSLALPACLFAWLLPGGGHFLLRRSGTGLQLLATIGLLFGLGTAMHARLDPHLALEDPLAVVMNVCQMCCGGLYLLARALGLGASSLQAVTHEYGDTFTAAAGLLNLLAMLHAYDVALGRK